MPRKADEFEVLETKKRAPRKRVAKTADDSKDMKPKRVRKVVTKTSSETETVRKAPTPLAEASREKRFVRKHVVVIAVLMLLGVGSSAAIGLTDKGQINTIAIIDERNKKAAERGEQLIASEEQLLPDGGLIPADPATVVPTTASSSAATTTASTSPQGNVPRMNEEAEASVQKETATST